MMKDRKKSNVSPPTVDRQSELDELATGLLRQWFASGWKLGAKIPDYHVDYFLEQVELGELTGKFAYVQQKAHETVEFRDGFAKEVLKTKHLLYYSKVEIPVFLIVVDTKESQAWYLFIQEWIDKSFTADQISDTGTRTVRIPESQGLDDVPKFRTAFQRSLDYMKNRHPGSVFAALSAEERRLAAMNPKLNFRVDVVAGKKQIYFEPKLNEKVSFTLKVPGNQSKPLQDLYEYGKPITAPIKDITIDGFPNINAGIVDGLWEFKTSSEKVLEGQWSIYSDVPSHPFHLIVDGSFTAGVAGARFDGRIKNGPLRVEILLPKSKVSKRAKARLGLEWDLSNWEGHPILNLAHFEPVYALLRALTAGVRIKHVFSVKGREIFPGDLAQTKVSESAHFKMIQIIANARAVAKAFKGNPVLPTLLTITNHEAGVIEMLAGLATQGHYQQDGFKQEFGVTFRRVTDIPELLATADRPPGDFRAVKGECSAKVFGQELKLGILEYTMTHSKLVIPPEARIRLEAGNGAHFEAAVVGKANSRLTVRRIDREHVGDNSPPNASLNPSVPGRRLGSEVAPI